MKPQIKREVVVQQSQSNKQFLDIFVGTEGAAVWVQQNARQFDNGDRIRAIDTLAFKQVPGRGWLVVSPCYDVDEVIQYLETMGRNTPNT